jgi:hypothetical protein
VRWYLRRFLLAVAVFVVDTGDRRGVRGGTGWEEGIHAGAVEGTGGRRDVRLGMVFEEDMCGRRGVALGIAVGS